MAIHKLPKNSYETDCTLKAECFHCRHAEIEVEEERVFGDVNVIMQRVIISCKHCEVCEHYRNSKSVTVNEHLLAGGYFKEEKEDDGAE